MAESNGRLCFCDRGMHCHRAHRTTAENGLTPQTAEKFYGRRYLGSFPEARTLQSLTSVLEERLTETSGPFT